MVVDVERLQRVTRRLRKSMSYHSRPRGMVDLPPPRGLDD
jgi:hypothetical protein